jgi:hypothetical protein
VAWQLSFRAASRQRSENRSPPGRCTQSPVERGKGIRARRDWATRRWAAGRSRCNRSLGRGQRRQSPAVAQAPVAGNDLDVVECRGAAGVDRLASSQELRAADNR